MREKMFLVYHKRQEYITVNLIFFRMNNPQPYTEDVLPQPKHNVNHHNEDTNDETHEGNMNPIYQEIGEMNYIRVNPNYQELHGPSNKCNTINVANSSYLEPTDPNHQMPISPVLHVHGNQQVTAVHGIQPNNAVTNNQHGNNEHKTVNVANSYLELIDPDRPIPISAAPHAHGNQQVTVLSGNQLNDAVSDNEHGNNEHKTVSVANSYLELIDPDHPIPISATLNVNGNQHAITGNDNQSKGVFNNQHGDNEHKTVDVTNSYLELIDPDQPTPIPAAVEISTVRN